MIQRLYRFRSVTVGIALILASSVLANPVAAESQPQVSTNSCGMPFGLFADVLCAEPEQEETGETLGAFVRLADESQSPLATATPAPDPRLGMKEVAGVQKEYIYTDRVAKGPRYHYTRLREHPDEESERLAPIVNGDRVRVIRVDQTEQWYFVEIFKGHDEELIGEEGWVETWLIDDTDVPAEPTPTATPTPTEPPQSEDDDTDATDTTQSSETTPETSDDTTSEPAPGPAVSAGESAELFGRINAYRVDHGLPAFQTTDRLCSMANTRAPEIPGEVATGTIHAGFTSRGWGYPDVENAVGMGSVNANFAWWTNSGLHRGSILNPEFTYSCLACVNGNCVQIFSSQP